MGNMLGPKCHEGPGGRECHCCNVPPGKDRRVQRRSVKRGERTNWKFAVRFKKFDA
jgi:hypothetical protein